MKNLSTMALAGSVLLMAGGAFAQVKTIEGEPISATVTISAIEQSTRTMTVKDEHGISETIQAPPEIKRFSELKVGDTITARYYDNVVIRLKKPGEAALDLDTATLVKGVGQRPAGAAAAQRTITVTVTAMDPATSMVTVKGPEGNAYSRRVADKTAFAQLKVGDRLDITWTEALLVSVENAKK